MTIAQFQKVVWAYYKKHGRHDLPWRNLPAGRQGRINPYRILISEVMLQQTQVERVIPFYKTFIKTFPTAKKLAAASLSEVLKAWQGLGYNRRAKHLRAAAKDIITRFGGELPESIEDIESLSGVGPYTARAIAAFAYNQDVVFVETNIRTAIIHHFFACKKKVSDAEIEKILKRAAPDVASAKSGEWYSALMDYGAYLKRSGISHNAQSKKYTKQSKFAGSLREARGAILRAYTRGVASRAQLLNLLGPSRRAQARAALNALETEGLITSQSARG